MADALDVVLVEELKCCVNASPVIALIIDDNNAYNLTEYIFHEILFIKDGQRKSEFLILQPLTNNNATNATFLTKALLASIQNVLGMSRKDLGLKLVAFGSDAHNTTLVDGVINEDALYVWIEAAVKDAHSYFARSPQCWAGFKYHADACNTLWLRMLLVHDLRWLCVKGGLSNIITKYASLISSLLDDMTPKDSNNKFKLVAEKLYAQFMQIDIMFGCRVFMRQFELFHYLSKFCQQWNVLFE
ncbi:hypothetical protein AXG93_4473s1010 [Marchantia polymorpha subsp. ruderalis]|uniref:DUF4371 domain-containing protein n=1 Tax=Marchantia polymorpha subsp. ruderalis TaxID=1480154 RepID=A0A176VDT8_MARPO|nr:hypothetical protein AXG93_4473s1010 [Marchantia polymorpha subsp. ruderalis]